MCARHICDLQLRALATSQIERSADTSSWHRRRRSGGAPPQAKRPPRRSCGTAKPRSALAQRMRSPPLQAQSVATRGRGQKPDLQQTHRRSVAPGAANVSRNGQSTAPSLWQPCSPSRFSFVRDEEEVLKTTAAPAIPLKGDTGAAAGPPRDELGADARARATGAGIQRSYPWPPKSNSTALARRRRTALTDHVSRAERTPR